VKVVFNWWVEEREVFREEMAWARLENTLVQILVVVVITKLRTFWTEVENGFRWRAFRSELVDPKRFVKYDKKCKGFIQIKTLIELKGKLVNIPVLDFAVGGNSGCFGIIIMFRWRKWTLRLWVKEGIEISFLFKRKKANVRCCLGFARSLGLGLNLISLSCCELVLYLDQQ